MRIRRSVTAWTTTVPVWLLTSPWARAAAEEEATAADAQPSSQASSVATEVTQLYLGNEAWRFGALFLAILAGWIAGRAARAVLHGLAKRSQRRGRQTTAAVCDALRRGVAALCLLTGVYVGTRFLSLSLQVQQIVGTTLAVLFSLAVAWMAYSLVDVVEIVLTRFASRTPSKLDDMLVPMVRASLRITVVVLTIVQVATILSQKPLTSVIAGLGVGGLAIGLAAQDMIKNFFGSMMIFSDRPFELGDRIVVDGFDGPVESVGFRSTRIRTLDGHLVTIPNGELANKAICNISKRPNIKRSFNIGITYDTPPEKVDRAIEILHEILDDHRGMAAELPPRIYFTRFDDSALVITVIYWYHPADYWSYCQFNQEVNMEILRRFNAEGIEFAFPTQTLHLIPPSESESSAA